MDWLDLLAVQGTLKSLLQHHNSKASILWHPNFFIVQLSHPYMTTGKTIALTRWTFVGKVMSLLFNVLSSLVITFLARSKQTQDKMKDRGVWQATVHEVAKNWTVQWLNNNNKLLFGNKTSKLQSSSLLNSCPLSRYCSNHLVLLLLPSLFVFSLSQNQGLFQRVGSLHQIAKVLKL